MELISMEWAMKACTLAGLVVAALGLAYPRFRPRTRAVFLVLAGSGAGLMFANRLLGVGPTGFGVDLAYLLGSLGAMARARRRRTAAPKAAPTPAASAVADARPVLAPAAELPPVTLAKAPLALPATSFNIMPPRDAQDVLARLHQLDAELERMLEARRNG